MDGLWWKTLWTNGWFVGFYPYFWKHPYVIWCCLLFYFNMHDMFFWYAYRAWLGRWYVHPRVGIGVYIHEMHSLSGGRWMKQICCIIDMPIWEVYPCLQRGKTGGWKRKCCLGPKLQNELKMFSRMVEEKKVGAWNIADHPRNRQILVVFLAATLMLLRLSVRVRYSKQ